MKVRSDDILESPKFPFRQDKSKLLVFNVHRTLLDCSSVEDPNPNPSIRYTLKTLTRRVVCRPWMVDLLFNCFQKFEVAFWGSKSSLYMEEVVPTMLGMLRGDRQFVPLFIWSQKECQPVEFEGGAPILWRKPLERVYEHWPRWNKSNTIIIDHKVDRVGCNRGPNIIVPKPFSVVDMENLGDDLLHLKSTLWPLLETLYGSKDV
jgi:hypothetical protein